MNCPACNAAKAYVGATVVECPNEKCQHFNPKQLPPLPPPPRKTCLIIHSAIEWIVRGENGSIADGFDTEGAANSWAVANGYSPLYCLVENRTS